MVYADYCVPYPKQLCVVHEANMWCPCCMTSSVLDPTKSTICELDNYSHLHRVLYKSSSAI